MQSSHRIRVENNTLAVTATNVIHNLRGSTSNTLGYLQLRLESKCTSHVGNSCTDVPQQRKQYLHIRQPRTCSFSRDVSCHASTKHDAKNRGGYSKSMTFSSCTTALLLQNHGHIGAIFASVASEVPRDGISLPTVAPINRTNVPGWGVGMQRPSLSSRQPREATGPRNMTQKPGFADLHRCWLFTGAPWRR